MRHRLGTALLVCALILLLIVLSACDKPLATQDAAGGDSRGSVKGAAGSSEKIGKDANAPDGADAEEIAEQSDAPESPDEGKSVTQPARGSAERTALMDAARVLTGSSRQFVVWQLAVQGDSAIGDLQESIDGASTGNRWLVAWQRDGGAWKAVYHAPFLDAARDEVRAEVPNLTNDLVGNIAFVVPFVPTAGIREAESKAKANGERIHYPTRVPEGWDFSFQWLDYGAPGGIEGTEHWHLQEWSYGDGAIAVFIGSHEGDMSEARDTPLKVSWGLGEDRWIYATEGESVEVGVLEGDGYFWSDMWGPDTPRNRALMTAMAMSVNRVNP